MKELASLLVVILVPATLRAQEEKEWIRFEVTGIYWVVNTTGDVQSGTTRVDVKSDLGFNTGASHFWGKLALKPARKHRFVFEGIPYRLEGDSLLTRQITYAGTTYNVSDRVTSNADLNYFYGGYQYDVISRGRGHFGLNAGVAWFDASGTIRSATLATSSSDQISLPVPLAGAEFRAFFLPESRLLSAGAEVKGMSFGGYGRYLQAAFNFGIGLGRHISVLGGYAVLDVDVHKNNGPEGVNLRFTGPTVSLQLRDR